MSARLRNFSSRSTVPCKTFLRQIARTQSDRKDCRQSIKTIATITVRRSYGRSDYCARAATVATARLTATDPGALTMIGQLTWSRAAPT